MESCNNFLVKKTLFTIIKIAIATGLVYWLTQNGKIDFKQALKSLKHPVICLKALLFFLLITILGAFRWRLVIQAFTQKPITYGKVFLYTWMGYFFNIAMPGSVSGDLIKVFLVRKELEGVNVKSIALTAIVDRVTGIFGFFTLIGLLGIINYSTFATTAPKALILVQFSILLFILMLITIGVLFLTEKLKEKIFTNLKKVPFSIVRDLVTAAEVYVQPLRRIILPLVGISMVVQIITITTFITIAKVIIPEGLNTTVAFSAIPLGFITIAIPLAPGGFGVGHVAFEKIFTMFNISGGANYFNLYFLWWTLYCLTGSAPYMLSGIKVNKKELENENL